jgi:hypothetical protein
MTSTEAERIFREIVAAITGDDDLRRLQRDFLLLAVRYARTRTDWRLADRETRLGMDGARTAAHNALIDACNILSRACAKVGRPTEWRRRLGDDRKEIGDFACHVHAHLGILAR